LIVVEPLDEVEGASVRCGGAVVEFEEERDDALHKESVGSSRESKPVGFLPDFEPDFALTTFHQVFVGEGVFDSEGFSGVDDPFKSLISVEETEFLGDRIGSVLDRAHRSRCTAFVIAVAN